MHLIRTHYVLLALYLLFALPRVASSNEVETVNLVVMFDRSESIQSGGPHSQMAVASHVLNLSQLTSGRIEVAFVLFGAETKLIAGDDGKPTAASEPIRKAIREALNEPCSGGTPLPTAFERLNELLDKVRGQQTTVLLISDGLPSLPLSFDLFPAVKSARDKEVNQRRQSGGEQAVEEYLNRLRDPHSKEAQQLYEIQHPLTLQRCCQLAMSTRQHRVRFVSIAFQPGMEALRSIHEAAGGMESDYLECEPSSAIAHIHKANIAPGVIGFPIIEFQESEDFRFSGDIPLAPELKAASLITAQFPATPQFEELATTGFRVGGISHTTSTGSLQLSHDSESHLNTISVLAPTADSARFGYASVKEELKFPGCAVFRWIELPQDLRVVCRPSQLDPTTPVPFELKDKEPIEWLVGLQWSDGSAVPLQSGEVVFKNSLNDREILLPLHSATGSFKNLLQTLPQSMEPGAYSVDVNLTLQSGLPLSTTLERHCVIKTVQERVRLVIGDESESTSNVDFGFLGDESVSRRVSIKLESDTPVELPLQIRVIDLKDQLGTAVAAEWITPEKRELILPAGDSVALTLDCSLPAVPENLTDGQFEGLLEIVNAHTQEPVELLAAAGRSNSDDLNVVRFTLQRPTFEVSAPRAWRNLVREVEQRPTLVANANVTFPYERDIVLRISTTSKVSREVTLKLGRCRNADDTLSETVSLEPMPGIDSTFVIEPEESFVYRLPMSVCQKLTRGYGTIVITGDGMLPYELPFEVGSTSQHGRWLSWLYAIVAILIGVLGYRRWRQCTSIKDRVANPKQTAPRPYPTGSVQGLFNFGSAGEDRVVLVPAEPNLQIEIGLDEPRLMDFEEYVTCTETVVITSPDQRRIRIETFDPDGDVAWVVVESGGPLEKRFRRLRRRARIAAGLAASFLFAAIGIRYFGFIIEWTQFGFDLCHLS